MALSTNFKSYPTKTWTHRFGSNFNMLNIITKLKWHTINYLLGDIFSNSICDNSYNKESSKNIS